MTIRAEDRRICLSVDIKAASDGTPVSYPIEQTSLFTFPTFGNLIDGLSDEFRSHVYTRGRNRTVDVLENSLAALEKGEHCKAFASGMAAISSVMMGLLEQGDHILFVNQIYGPTLQLAEHLKRFGLSYDCLSARDAHKIEDVIRPETRMIWVETPGTMMFELVDLQLVTEVARSKSIWTVMDNSWSTPLFQKPITMGVDIVVHSCTKYLGGHSDIVGGAVISSEEILEQIFYRAFLLNGGALGPFDAWLTSRSIRTLPVRMAQHQAGGLAVADFLKTHPRVARVHHPAFARNKGLLEKQMQGTSGLFSFELKDAGYKEIAQVLDMLGVVRLGVSWGGFESLAISPNRGDNVDALKDFGIPEGLIRLSIGQEDPEDLINDLEQALGQ